VRSAHDCADGGLAVALAECCMMERGTPTGADVDLSPWAALPERALLFGEAQGRVVVSTPDPQAVLALAARHGVPAATIGTVRRDGALRVRIGARSIVAPLDRLATAWHESIPRIMQRSASALDVLLASDSVV
jgi:phosphoribosylformylglycinamidine synthase